MAGRRQFERLKSWTNGLKKEVRVLYLVYRHPSTPTYVKLWAVLIVAYAISPIDLIPDFIPVIGYLDDLLLLPLGIWLAIKIIPPEILAECRQEAERPLQISNRLKWAAVACIVLFWAAAMLSLGFWAYHRWFVHSS